MPYYFAYPSRSRGPSANAVTINGETYEPSEPSRIKLFPMISAYSIITSLWTSIIALVVGVLSYRKGAYREFTTEGMEVGLVEQRLPFRLMGLAFAVKKGAEISEELIAELHSRDFKTMEYQRKTLYFKDLAGKLDFKGWKRTFRTLMNLRRFRTGFSLR